MAVLVRRMVAADAAGVAFTANPATGDRSETIVSAVRGLGERLVSGETSPEKWIVAGGRATQRSIDVPTQVKPGPGRCKTSRSGYWMTTCATVCWMLPGRVGRR
jgi:hypothetical protein